MMEIIKKSKIMGELVIKEIDYNTAKEITIKNHYSKKWNTAFGKYNFGIFKDGELLGVAVYGNLMNPNSYKKWHKDLEKGQVIELNRMWIDDKLGKNAETILLSSSFKLIKMNYKHIIVIQTFADGRLGCGTIYKATSFNYYGFRETLFFEDVKTGVVYHKVPMENSKRPKGFLKLNKLFLDGRLKPFYVKTYEYGFILRKDWRKKIDRETFEYPIYEKGLEYIHDYKHPLGLCSRVLLYLEEIHDVTYYNLMQDYIDENYNCFDFTEELKKQKQNDSFKWFCESYDKSNIVIEKQSEVQTTLFDFI